MTDTVINMIPAHINMTGVFYMTYAKRYRDAAVTLLTSSSITEQFDPVAYFLMCLSLELHLKSFIWLHDNIDSNKIRNKYRHNIEKLWQHSKERGINKYAQQTPLRDHIIALIGPYYKNRKLNYLDIDMIFNGYDDLTSNTKVLPALSRLTKQLEKSLKAPILRSS